MPAIAITDYYVFDNSIRLRKLAKSKGHKIKVFLGAEIPVCCDFLGERRTVHLAVLNLSEHSEAFNTLRYLIKKNCTNESANISQNWFESITEASEYKIRFSPEERALIINKIGHIDSHKKAIKMLITFKGFNETSAKNLVSSIDKTEGAVISASEVIRLTNEAGGIAVLVHPTTTINKQFSRHYESEFSSDMLWDAIDDQDFEDIHAQNIYRLNKFKEILQGLIDGDLKDIYALEIPKKPNANIDYSDILAVSKLDRENMFYKAVMQIADKNDLEISAGSDFHNEDSSYCKIGFVNKDQSIKCASVLKKLDANLYEKIISQYEGKPGKVILEENTQQRLQEKKETNLER